MIYMLISSLFVITTILVTVGIYKIAEMGLSEFKKTLGYSISFGKCLTGSLFANLFVYAIIVAVISY